MYHAIARSSAVHKFGVKSFLFVNKEHPLYLANGRAMASIWCEDLETDRVLTAQHCML